MTDASPRSGPGPGRDFGHLYDTLAPELEAWVEKHLHSDRRPRLEREDVAQEVWLRATRAWPSFDPRRSTIRRWLQRIARRTLLDLLRSLRAARAGLGDAAGKEPGNTARESLAGELVRQEILRRFLDELATLPHEDRELLMICGVEGRPSSAAARELAISGAAARKRWLRLRRRLAQRTDLAALMQ